MGRMKLQAAESRGQLDMMEKEIGKLQQVIRESDMERKRQMKELDQVISERDILGTQLVRRNDELSLLYEKIMNHQIDQLKEEITTKEAALVKINLDHTRVEKEKEQLRAELLRMKLQAAESRGQLDMMEKEIGKLQQVIRESDMERKR